MGNIPPILGPGPNMEHLLATEPKPSARNEREMDEIEKEGAKDGYQIPQPGTPYKERYRLFKQWIERRQAGGCQHSSPGPLMGNPFAGMGRGSFRIPTIWSRTINGSSKIFAVQSRPI